MTNFDDFFYHGRGMHFGSILGSFWPPFGALLAPFGLPLAPFWLPLAPFGSLLAPFGSLWLTFGSLWLPLAHIFVPFGSLFAPFGSLLLNFLTLGVSWRRFWSLSDIFNESLMTNRCFQTFFSEFSIFYTPASAKHL